MGKTRGHGFALSLSKGTRGYGGNQQTSFFISCSSLPLSLLPPPSFVHPSPLTKK